MKNIKTFTAAFIAFILAIIFHNCAPLVESGSFQNPSISVSNSVAPNKNNTNGNGNTTDKGENDKDEESDDEEKKEDDKKEEDKTPEEEEKDDNNTPKGPEFTGTESEETGKTPITRGLY